MSTEAKETELEAINRQIAELTKKKTMTEEELLAEKRRKLARLPMNFCIPAHAMGAVASWQIPGMRLTELSPTPGADGSKK